MLDGFTGEELVRRKEALDKVAEQLMTYQKPEKRDMVSADVLDSYLLVAPYDDSDIGLMLAGFMLARNIVEDELSEMDDRRMKLMFDEMAYRYMGWESKEERKERMDGRDARMQDRRERYEHRKTQAGTDPVVSMVMDMLPPNIREAIARGDITVATLGPDGKIKKLG
jgi:hypothetical protein